MRRAARAVTQLYDEALRPLGLRITQFTVLQALTVAGKITQGDLGRVLVMDSTTLSRTLKLMEKEGWIQSVRGEDRRERYLEFTTKGRRLFERALPLWDGVQSRLRKSVGQKQWAEMTAAMDRMAGAAATA